MRASPSSSSGPASAVPSNLRASSNAPAPRLAWAAASARSARSAGSAVSATARCKNAAAGRESAARLGPRRRTFQPKCGLLVRPNRGRGQVPGAAVRVAVAVGGFCQGAVHAVAVAGSSGAVGGGPDQWVRELDAASHLEQPGVRCRVGRRHLDAEARGGTVKQHRVAERLRGRGEDEQPRVGREPQRGAAA